MVEIFLRIVLGRVVHQGELMLGFFRVEGPSGYWSH